MYTSSGLAYYRHAEWLGSSRFASTPSRTKYFDVAYAPYGEDYADSGTVDLNFTGPNQDTVSGMYDFLYREYHANSGRWIQPDPAGLSAADPSNPQSWNRYAYVGNRPLNSVDPLGLLRSDCMGCISDSGCYLTFSCTVYIDQFGMQLDNAFAQQLLRLNAASFSVFGPHGAEYAQGAGSDWEIIYPGGRAEELSPDAVAELGLSYNSTSTTGPPDPTDMRKPLFCNAALRRQAGRAFQLTINGNARSGLAEAGFAINLLNGRLSFGSMVNSVNSDGPPNHLFIPTNPEITIAILHTHGNRALAEPSAGDLRSQYPNFVVSQSSWYVTVPGTNNSIRLNSGVCR